MLTESGPGNYVFASSCGDRFWRAPHDDAATKADTLTEYFPIAARPVAFCKPEFLIKSCENSGACRDARFSFCGNVTIFLAHAISVLIKPFFATTNMSSPRRFICLPEPAGVRGAVVHDEV
ncbi:hypothetical protein Fuma_06089 [Fuerstiella marisgermanici]|uniref:Uncharacterized protein n=1 Tax=Fuerstiella marisgermanici TaxID=1891926 RepID=A0A1P8WQT8_9PLAN|nr:hypothetical protein Fuma_06089 [Fuerstiella marisgermanici]